MLVIVPLLSVLSASVVEAVAVIASKAVLNSATLVVTIAVEIFPEFSASELSGFIVITSISTIFVPAVEIIVVLVDALLLALIVWLTDALRVLAFLIRFWRVFY